MGNCCGKGGGGSSGKYAAGTEGEGEAKPEPKPGVVNDIIVPAPAGTNGAVKKGPWRKPYNRGATGSIMLIGTPQSGKSALCNFLVRNAGPEKGKKNPFAVGTGSKHCTEQVCEMRTTWRSEFVEGPGASVTVIDTPGLGDDDDSTEPCQYLDIIEKLVALEREEPSRGISEIVLVWHMGKTVLDQQYKSTVEQYRSIFPSEFKNNLVVVITGVKSANAKWMQEVPTTFGADDDDYDREPADVLNRYLKDVEKSFRELLELPADVELAMVTIDSQPRSDDELRQSQAVRDYLLERAIVKKQTMSNVSVFPKPQAWLNADATELKRQEAKFQLSSERMNLFQTEARNLAVELGELAARVVRVDASLQKAQRDLSLIDTNDNVVQYQRTVRKGFRFNPFGGGKVEFEYAAKYSITHLEVIGSKLNPDPGNPPTKTLISSCLQHGWMRRLCATVKLYARSSQFYAEDIAALHEREANLERDLAMLAKKREALEAKKGFRDERVAAYAAEVDAAVQRSKMLNKPTLSVKEFTDRVKDNGRLATFMGKIRAGREEVVTVEPADNLPDEGGDAAGAGA